MEFHGGKFQEELKSGQLAGTLEGWRITISGNNVDGWIITKEKPDKESREETGRED